ncbi:DsrE family protein [Erythrobacter alti]|uniref:DsrE family protein n=1 Tax=Erythrobacter alti TaxID=1896145 RepID=UPI0030F42A8B
MLKLLLSALIGLLVATPLAAQDFSAFREGPVFTDFGAVVEVDFDQPLPADVHFRHSYDVAKAAGEDGTNRGIESAARFVNMMALHGVPRENVEVAVVVHGAASLDLLGREAFAARFDGRENLTAAALSEMMEQGITIYLCGQSAAAHGIDKADLVPGVQMAISAMTAHALLQQQGYTVNPF